MTLSAVCARLEISRTSAKRLIPKLKGYRVGRLWRFDEADVEAFIQSQKFIQEQQRLERDVIGRVQKLHRTTVVDYSAWPGSERYS